MEIRNEKGQFVRKYRDITGQRFFRLLAIKKVDNPRDRVHAYWLCKCDCGKSIVVRKDSLVSGHAKSCGCYLQERYKDGHLKTHGDKGTKLYKAWQGMKQRCYNPNCREYHNYGGRGITICPEWLNDYSAFKTWSLSHGFDFNQKGHDMTIDRIDVNGNYEPSNCRWVGHEIQNYNKRCTVYVSIGDSKLTLKEISNDYHIPMSTLRSRYKKYKGGKIDLETLLKTS